MKILEQIKQKILSKILIDPNTECWLWQGYADRDGYARIEVIGGKNKFVHRLSYEAFTGSIPEGMSIDHICKNRGCCNPKHLQQLSIKENILRGDGASSKNNKKTHCNEGHEFSAENTYINNRSARVCKTCAKISANKNLDKKKSGVSTARKTAMERIIPKLAKTANGCQIWHGKTSSDGYAKMVVGAKETFVHKVVYEENNGKVPDGFGVYRKCGNSLCCALEHLYILPLGTVPSKITLVKSGG